MLLPRAEAYAVVADGDGDRVAVRAHGDHHIAAFAVLYSVHEQVPQDALHPAPVHFGDTRLRGEPGLDAAGAALGELRGGGALPQPSRPAATTTITALMWRESTRAAGLVGTVI